MSSAEVTRVRDCPVITSTVKMNAVEWRERHEVERR